MVDSSKRSSAEKIIDEINITNAKKVAVVLVLGFIIYHGLLHLQYGPDSCTWLLSDGRYKGDHEWQPYGCMLHKYSQTNTRHCFRYLAFWGKQNTFAFLGDINVQQLFDHFISHVQINDITISSSPKVRSNSSFADTKLRLSAEFTYSPLISTKMIEKLRDWEKSDHPPSIIVLGCILGTMEVHNSSLHEIEEFKRNLSRLVQPASKLHAHGSSVVWLVQGPVDGEVTQYNYVHVTDQMIDMYNDAAQEIFRHSAIKIWDSSRLIAMGAPSPPDHLLFLSPTAVKHHTQILLNMYCNDHMNFDDGTCCATPESYTTLQIVTFSILVVCMILTVMLFLYEHCRRRSLHDVEYHMINGGPVPPIPNAYHTLTALSILGLIVSYFYLCDRTNFFMKENKYYSEWSFWFPVGYVLILGLFFTEDSKSPRVLHRDQTIEWRGWMQLLILGAQVTGAARLLPNHMILRALSSAYLFMSGYGHFCYIWHTGNTGLVRVFHVLFRLNFMTVVLCFTMNRPYQFYQFVPLVSFWIVLLYAVMALPPYVTAHTCEGNPYQYFYLVLKFIGLFIVITVLYMSEVFFEKVFVTRPWKALFVTTDDDIQQWWDHWKRDRYSLWCGAVFAACFQLAQRHQLLDDSSYGNLFKPRVSVAAAVIALGAMGGWFSLPFLCGSRQECDEIHSYIGAIPVVSYIILRNVSGALRSRHSSFLAWFGDISLELFVCQHHIWLAADTHGVLVLVPSAPNLNLLLTSFVFVCASHEVHRLTQLLAPVAVPQDLAKCLRNFLLFLVILVPIGIHDGMF